MRKHIFGMSAGLVLLLGAVTPAAAQIVHSITVGGGGFYPRGFNGRTEGDTVVANLIAEEPLLFSVGDFKSGQVFGEWNVAFGHRLEVGTGLAYYGKTVHSIYANLVNEDRNFADIPQDLRLRVVPLSGVVRFLPFGNFGTFQPYVGAGVAALFWRYSEVGEFVDLSDNTIFLGNFQSSGVSPAFQLLGGFRAPIKGDVYGFTMEWRYQFASGDTGGLNQGFLGDKIDLSGGWLNFGLLIRF
jgi:hypothetical protein